MTTVFTNPGTVDPFLLTTLGTNVKSSSAIGHFGTGAKYGIATVLRAGGQVTIVSDGTQYVFDTRPHEARDKVFQVVTLATPGEPPKDLGFTTELGKDWQLWMAFREFWSNMRDEGGEDPEVLADNDLIGRPDHTHVLVSGLPEFDSLVESCGDFLISGRTLVATVPGMLEVYHDTSRKIFYRGIAVADTGQRESLWTYNILSEQTLTEDRTLDSWNCRYAIASGVAQCTDRRVVESVLMADPMDYFDGSLDFTSAWSMSEEFRAAVKLANLRNESAKRQARSLYKGDWVPTALARTPEEAARIDEFMRIVTWLGLDHPQWTDVAICDDPVISVHGETLFVPREHTLSMMLNYALRTCGDADPGKVVLQVWLRYGAPGTVDQTLEGDNIPHLA